MLTFLDIDDTVIFNPTIDGMFCMFVKEKPVCKGKLETVLY